jgi:hypothetical protein
MDLLFWAMRSYRCYMGEGMENIDLYCHLLVVEDGKVTLTMCVSFDLGMKCITDYADHSAVELVNYCLLLSY